LLYGLPQFGQEENIGAAARNPDRMPDVAVMDETATSISHLSVTYGRVT
jgi:hypothetical protein